MNNSLLNSYRKRNEQFSASYGNPFVGGSGSVGNKSRGNEGGNGNSFHANMRRNNDEYQMRQIERMNEIEQSINMDKVKEIVIKPLNAKTDRFEHKEIKKKHDELEKNYEPQRSEYWKDRTNQPYKNIIKDRAHIDKFIGRKKINEKELIVHKVTTNDKKGVKEKYENLEKNIKTHNNELAVIYSTSNETDHKKKFEYNHKYKYRQAYNPSDHNEMKKDRIDRLKKDQMKMEADREKVDSILEVLLDDGDLEDDDIKELTVLKKEKSKKIKEINPMAIEIKSKDHVESNHNSANKISQKRNIVRLDRKTSVKTITPQRINSAKIEESKPRANIKKLDGKSTRIIIKKK